MSVWSPLLSSGLWSGADWLWLAQGNFFLCVVIINDLQYERLKTVCVFHRGGQHG